MHLEHYYCLFKVLLNANLTRARLFKTINNKKVLNILDYINKLVCLNNSLVNLLKGTEVEVCSIFVQLTL